ncbi:class I mannose-6-phosphate isomerase [Pedobacter foliorum]|uniref:class I mannose-6-phosphate isomerase n=1 Tax=Pedobacter foliorum TaxID=2739058 RepID=UPI0015667AAA|nr:class I mannose-6-phosphate isomerase [Pedobacter foliorum]NRF41422.1 class I mannose-6-phosphate isomerase [Pedobacter foliorum]
MIEASEATEKDKIQAGKSMSEYKWRNSTQPLLQQHVYEGSNIESDYNPIPYHKLGKGKIYSGFGSLVAWIIEQKNVLIDGYGGVFFNEIQQEVQQKLEENGFSVKWHFTSDYFKSETDVEEMVKPFLGGSEDVWGFKTNLNLKDFFKLDEFLALEKDNQADINIVIGIGAGLLNWDAPVVYFDIPKNEIQYRMRAGSVSNLGTSVQDKAYKMYKRFYFVDWVVLNNYKTELLEKIAVIADGQRVGRPNWLFKSDLVEGLHKLSHSVLRARPWFESGSWGGQWMKEHLNGLNASEVNYAWSFELITPENGVVLESDGNLLEIPFDLLMTIEYQAILGKHAEQFGNYFPIRFDFLDTFKGGNLSIQCHPSKSYIREKFGETITQDETYYILDCEPGAKVYLGFQEDIDPQEFRTALEVSQLKKQEILVEKYVRSFPSRKHELFLIPNGTVHSSGINNMVLEISATPYIFTFKMYDWLALDLNGQPRPINIEHAFNNLRFERKGALVPKELIAKQVLFDRGNDWEILHLPTHKEHFYDVHRIEFETEVVIETEDRCHVLMLVEGTSISVEVAENETSKFHYAETFIIPAATQRYKLINHGKGKAKVIKAFLKNDIEL